MRAVVTYEGEGAGVVRDALRPEAGREIPRARVSVVGEGDLVEIRVDADDTNALRAALNSYLRWAQVALDVNRTVTA
jgi:KEOPS complex subunit Pcc1